MSRVLLSVGMGVAWWIMSNQPIAAQTPRPRIDPRQEKRYGAATDIRRISSVVGARVLAQGDLTVGTIEDVVFSEDGCIDFLVVAREDKFVLVPFRAARLDFEHRRAFIELPRERFMQVQSFTKDRWPNISDRRFVENLRTTFGLPPGQERKIEKRESERRK